MNIHRGPHRKGYIVLDDAGQRLAGSPVYRSRREAERAIWAEGWLDTASEGDILLACDQPELRRRIAAEVEAVL